jgi:hypothetical protein
LEWTAVAAIVSCPGCQKRLKLGTDKPGGKLRCPACNTPFVLGSRTNSAAEGVGEYLAFELFEDHVEVDNFEIVEEKPAKPKATAPTVRPAPATVKADPKPPAKAVSKPASSPPRPAVKKAEELLPDDLDLLGEGSAKPATPPPAAATSKPAPPPIEANPASPPPAAIETPILPDDFTGLADEKPVTFPPKPKPKSVAESKAQVESKSQPRPSIESKPEPKAAVKSAAPKPDDFFLPANFDLGAFAAPTPKDEPVPNLVLDDDDQAGSQAVIEEFEVIDTAPRRSSDGVPLIEGVEDDEIAEIEQAEREFEQAREEQEVRARSRAERRQKRMTRRTAAQAINSQVRGRWTMVFWGVTFELAAVVCFGASLALTLVTVAVAVLGIILANGPLLALSGIIWIVILGLIGLSSIFDMIGRALSIPCPAKNSAMIWAILSAAFGIAGLIGLLPVSFIGLIFYLVFLKFAAEALREYSLAQECVTLIKLVIVGVIASTFLFIFIVVAYLLGASAVFASKDGQDATNLGYVMFALGLIFGMVGLILSAVISYKFFEILQEFRNEIRWRLES